MIRMFVKAGPAGGAGLPIGRAVGHKGAAIRPFLKDYSPFMRISRLALILAVPLAAGCSTLDSVTGAVGLSSTPGNIVSEAGHTPGLAVADEPFAARAGAAVLARQGNAVDAVTTMFFALSATYPVAAGLGGGGICLVRDRSGTVREFDFLARAPRAGGAFAVPGAVRGFHAMQRRMGSLPWQSTVAPGEAFAATGFPISEALAERLAANLPVIRLDASLAAEFLDQSGQPKPAGTVTHNSDLSETLAAVRLGEDDGFYKGPVAARIAAYSAAQQGGLTAGDLAGYPAEDGPARLMTLGAYSVALPGPRTGAGAFAAGLMNNLSRAGAGDAEDATSQAVRQTLASFGVTSLPPDLGATGFAALDAAGQAASCAVTLNGPFGAGRTAAGTGVVMAASPTGETGIASAFLTPAIAADAGGVALAGAGTGGPNGTAAIAYALLKLAAGQPLGRRADLRGTGQEPRETVNAITCQNGLCVALPDPAGKGLGAVADIGQ
jgi:gamma-glutamyltranspeptidase/glutathione hydrolase